MDPRTAQLLLELASLGRTELPPEQASAVEEHLRAQPGGAALLAEDHAFDRRMRTAMADVPVPPGLRGQILARLAERRTMKFRRRAWQTLSAAAAVLLVVTLGYNLSRFFRPGLDAEALAAVYEPQAQRPFESAVEWLAGRGIRFNPDVPLDPSLLAAHELVEFQGRDVPMLFFAVNERVWLRLYVVDSGRFDLADVPVTQAQQSYCSVSVIRDAERPDDVAYVAVYTGGSLRPFLLGGPAHLTRLTPTADVTIISGVDRS